MKWGCEVLFNKEDWGSPNEIQVLGNSLLKFRLNENQAMLLQYMTINNNLKPGFTLYPFIEDKISS